MQEPLATDMDIKDEILTDDEKRSGVYITKNGRVRKDRTTNYVYGSGPGSKKVLSDDTLGINSSIFIQGYSGN